MQETQMEQASRQGVQASQCRQAGLQVLRKLAPPVHIALLNLLLKFIVFIGFKSIMRPITTLEYQIAGRIEMQAGKDPLKNIRLALQCRKLSLRYRRIFRLY